MIVFDRNSTGRDCLMPALGFHLSGRLQPVGSVKTNCPDFADLKQKAEEACENRAFRFRLSWKCFFELPFPCYNPNMTENKQKRRWEQMAVITALSAVVICLVIMAASAALGSVFNIKDPSADIHSAQAQNQEEDSPDKPKETTDSKLPAEGDYTLHFTGVGDNLLHDVIFTYFEEDNGNRDYGPIYAATAPYFQNADLAYINFETVCAGDDYGLSGYPNFNGPLEMIDTLAGMSIDWMSTSSNHSMDTGAEGLMNEMNYLEEKYPEIDYTGTHLSAEAKSEPVVREVNGIKVGLAGLTYGMNGYTNPEGMDYLVDVFLDYNMENIDYAAIDAAVDPLMDVSDIQMVAMHWGIEYQTVPNEIQKEVARYLNEKGVEVIIGTHPHVIQPVELIQSEDQTTLCYYSLGNFLSAQDQAQTMVGGMADFTLRYDPKEKKTEFTEIRFIPTITWISPDLRTYHTYTIKEYTDEMAAGQFVSVVNGQDCSLEYVRSFVRDVMQEPEGIDIVYE